MNKTRIITAITTSGIMTLGNYIGAIKPMLDKSKNDQYELFMFIADLHALTSNFEPTTLKENIKKAIAIYLACGLHQKNVTIFVQSEISAHSELAWILNCHTTIGELSRMTQFKDKSSKKNANKTECIPSGLLNYPTLMVADILLYDANLVPVGIDQKQHIELTRNIAIRLNNKYGNIFTLPEAQINSIGAKIMNLQDPSKKMSKSSSNPKTYISLLDDYKTICKKINSSITDSENIIKYDILNKPGVSNLITIISSLNNLKINDVEKMLENKNYGDLKKMTIDAIWKTLQPIQEKFEILYNSKDLQEIIEQGNKKANIIANNKLNLVKEKIGLK